MGDFGQSELIATLGVDVCVGLSVRLGVEKEIFGTLCMWASGFDYVRISR